VKTSCLTVTKEEEEEDNDDDNDDDGLAMVFHFHAKCQVDKMIHLDKRRSKQTETEERIMFVIILHYLSRHRFA